MNPIRLASKTLSRRARGRRAEIFGAQFVLDENTHILDLGSENGEHIHSVVRSSNVRPANVYIADLDARKLAEGHSRFGFTPVHIEEGGALPFPDRFFDIVHCSSVIEHVTVPKELVWQVRCGSEFRTRALLRQAQFAAEIARLGRQYFVQTPHRAFLLESHSWLPFVGYLPRRLLVPLLAFTNRFWVKRTAPDWHLLDKRQLAVLFEDATIIEERVLGLVKSLIAVKRDAPAPAWSGAIGPARDPGPAPREARCA